MATLAQIKKNIASYCQVTEAELTENSQDLSLYAVNQVKMMAQLNHDFYFQNKLCTLNINSITGGLLTSAVLYGTETPADIKLILDIGQLDDTLNFVPAEWTTLEEGSERMRADHEDRLIRYPSDGQVLAQVCYARRFTLINDTLFSLPKSETSETIPVAIQAYVFDAPYSSMDTTSDFWTTRGEQYLTWAAIVQLNYRFKQFVARTEGNLPPPAELAQQGLQAIIDFDVYRYEQKRRHGR